MHRLTTNGNILQSRAKNIEIKQQKAMLEKEKNAVYHEMIMEKVAEFDAREAREEKQRKDKEKAVAQ